MTYNIHHGQGMDGKIDIKRISDICKDENADLVALQEVDRGVDRTGKIDIMDLFAKYTGMSITFGKNIDFQGGDYGNGILSKYKIDSVKNIHYKMIRPGEQRGMLQSVVNINGENVVFIDTHTGDKSNDEEKQMNVDEIISAIKDYPDMPVILCGDFNSTPDTKMHKALKEYFVDIWEMLNGSNGYSFPSVNPDRRIDYIYISKKSLNRTKPLSIKLIRSEASDHLPLIAEFELLTN